MRLFGRRSRGVDDVDSPRAERARAERALEEWVTARHGIEVYVEPRTTVTGVTMLLVAHDGEFTRRVISDPKDAAAFARSHAMPIYDAQVMGYPQRMRDYSRRQTVLRRRADQERDG